MSQLSAKKRPVVFILSVSSDIGRALADFYLRDGYQVIGTYRTAAHVHSLIKRPDCTLWRCDVSLSRAAKLVAAKFKQSRLRWDIFINCVGDIRPVTAFFSADYASWEKSFKTNALGPLSVLHAVYPFRRPTRINSVVFFAGGGANNAVVNLSAYTSAKIMLTKFCEFLDAENRDLNVFIVGPGWTKTKIHQQVLTAKEVSSKKFQETQKFMKEGKGTPLVDIYDCIRWLTAGGKPISGGRNFSIVHDPWRGNAGKYLIKALKSNSDMYKLRRCQNAWKP